jgi:hypothetical protein
MDAELNEFEFIGQVQLITEISNQMRQLQIYLKLTHTNQLLLIYPNNHIKSIPLESVIRVVDSSSSTSSPMIEVKWFDHSNSSIVSTHFGFVTVDELQIWLKRILMKLLGLGGQLSRIESKFEIIDWCQVDSMGILSLTSLELEKKENYFSPTWIVLIRTIDVQLDKFFKKALILIQFNPISFIEIDARKMVYYFIYSS